MDEVGIRAWFDEYLKVLAARGRGEADDLQALLEYYGVPLLVATDEGARALTAAEDVIGFARQQVDGMRAANYDHTETLDSEVTTLNTTSVLYIADFARQRADGTEIGRLGVTYLITDGPRGPRISALAIHTLTIAPREARPREPRRCSLVREAAVSFDSPIASHRTRTGRQHLRSARCPFGERAAVSGSRTDDPLSVRMVGKHESGPRFPSPGQPYFAACPRRT